ncbi:helix-turn-helix transcriptional regulator [Rheinheimera sp.]|uniref:helix-turn-helix domain-containing protein n=1 Tax=Rheinheimera sp. TaxID=1869214 RepID=UPI00307E1CA5
MLSEFGQKVRKYRIDLRLKLGEMAQGLSVTPAYLSAVENNKKKLTNELVEKVIAFLKLPSDEAEQLRDCAARSRTEHVINTKSQTGLANEAVAMFARNIESSALTEEKAKRILEILGNKG